MKTSIPPVLITFALVCFALSPTAQAVVPAPDGGYANNNTAEGTNALLHLTTGSDNTAIGFNALFSNTRGHDNTANGFYALINNTTGYANTATGVVALSSNTTGYDNTATGVQALNNNNAGVYNTATGFAALGNNTTGDNNTATGFSALRFNETGFQNTATGLQALQNNTTGFRNTADGNGALNNNTGSNNIGLGFNAGANLTTGSNNIDIGNSGAGGESNTIRIGSAQTRTFIKGISGAVVSGAAVVVNAGGQLGMAPSSARFKQEIQDMDKASDVLLALRPVSFRYKPEIDPEGVPQFGLVAEEVEKVNLDLVVRDRDGKAYTVRYEAVNAMLLNEFLKEHRKNEEQQKQINVLTAQLKEQSAQIQKVSAQLEASKPAPQMVNNP
jgi:trimeric autotransporter adhesin